MALADPKTQVMLGLVEGVLLKPSECRTLEKVHMILPLVRTTEVDETFNDNSPLRTIYPQKDGHSTWSNQLPSSLNHS